MGKTKSIMAISMHKAGSTIADAIFTEVAKVRGFQIDRINLRVPRLTLPEREVYRQYQPEMTTEGVYYGIARDPDTHDLEILGKLRLLIQVRDPRDCITSMYFSLRQSHVPPKDPEKLKEFEKSRARLQELEIDTYAVQVAGNYLWRLKKLDTLVASHTDFQFLTYEEMVTETPTWLDKVLTFMDQPMTDTLRTALAPHLDFSVSHEDVARHKRQITPGDHRRKLKPETIDKMNQILAPALRRFGYSD